MLSQTFFSLFSKKQGEVHKNFLMGFSSQPKNLVVDLSVLDMLGGNWLERLWRLRN